MDMDMDYLFITNQKLWKIDGSLFSVPVSKVIHLMASID